jgi:hypothetical protein
VPDVQQEVTLPTKEAYKTEVTTEKERRPSAQKIEVEVHKTTMKQKPTEIIAVVKEVSGKSNFLLNIWHNFNGFCMYSLWPFHFVHR